LSNTHYFVEALRASGRPADDPAIQKALVFISRCQNLESEHNTLPFAAKDPDGGFVYMPVVAEASGQERRGGGGGGGAGGEAAALRSYGSMTYAGLKSMIYAGLTPEDKRVHAALGWIKKNYDLTQNPGQGQNGLYYYYQTFSKALDTLKLADLEDASGKKHDWRTDLVSALAEKQNDDGSWVNASPRWMEGDPILVTGYVLMVLADCKK
jgi:squalene-hopene/tetraprenyl-beta-curcumene cyclase